MRHLRILILLGTIATLNSMSAQTKATCADWAKVTAWQGSYQYGVNGTATSGSTSLTINETAAASGVNMNTFGGVCPGKLFWFGPDSGLSGADNDRSETPCPPPGGTTIITVVGGSAGGSQSGLLIDPTAGTFQYAPAAGVNSTFTGIDCQGVTKSVPVDWPIAPFPTWPLTFTLPNSVQALSQSNFSFQDGSELTNGALISPPWTIGFQLTPIYNQDVDHPCPPPKDVASSIGCHNQSLKEDMPIVGTPFFLHYESSRSPGRSGAFGPAVKDALMLGGWTLNVHHAVDSGRTILFLGNGRQRSAWQLSPVAFNSGFLLTSEDGREVYVFDNTARHIQTLKPLTGAVKYQFGYDTAGNLISVTDGSGNVTTIQRDGSEHPTAIISPFAQTTTLGVDGNGFLNQITDPAGNTQTFTNDGNGLLMSRTDANSNQYSYSYDANGGLIKDADSIGGFTTLTPTGNPSGGDSVALLTAMGITSTFGSSTPQNPGEQLANTWPNGLQASETTTVQNGQISDNTTLPDGTSDSQTLGPDPRFRLQLPVLTSETLTQGTLTMNITGSRKATFTQGNPFSLTSETDTQAINGRTYTSVFTTASKSWADTSPMKRKMTTILDALERISSVQVGALTPLKLTYDANDRLATMVQGSRTTTMTYDANGFLASSTDPLNQTTGFTHDAAGRLKTETLPDGRVIAYGYDANGNLTSVAPPGQPVHDFSYTAVDEMSTYTPPAVPGTGPTTYTYNFDRDLTKITRPDGQTIQFGYDNAGRLSTTTTPTETITYAYDANTGNLNSAVITGGEALNYSFNGPLPTSSALTGTVAGTVSRSYNNNFWIASESINGGNTVNFSYDNDGLLSKAGSLTLKLDSKDGLITGTTLGSATDSRKYDSFGELTGYTAKYGIKTLYSDTFTRDADGRISGKTETIGGKKNSFIYSYDLADRLTGVKQNGVIISTYNYDSNSNRLSVTTPSGTVTGTYDAQDRLLTYGNASFTYAANGELASQTAGSQTTTYSYDVLGNLIGVSLPNGTAISYIGDARNRRVGKQVNIALVAGYLYDGDRVIAQLGGNNAIVSQFVYGSGSTSPDYMTQGGVTYRIFSDQLGSPRLVVNTSTGAVTEEIDYDEFGNMVRDTNPGFQPFGFAGGLYDQDTKLVRFGARDYNPAVGRWTAKDPIRFSGGDTNLYGYVLDDPVNVLDRKGLQGENCACSMPKTAPAAPKAVPFVNYTPGVAEIQAMVTAALNATPAMAGLESWGFNPGSISMWLPDLPNYHPQHYPKPNECWKTMKDLTSILKPGPNYPNSSDFNSGGRGNPQGVTQSGGPAPEPPEVEPLGEIEEMP